MKHDSLTAPATDRNTGTGAFSFDHNSEASVFGSIKIVDSSSIKQAIKLSVVALL